MEKIKILVVEDDDFFRDTVAKRLEREGFDVSSAGNSKEALEILETKKPNIVLLDIILPGMDGFELLSLIKKTESIKDISVMILSNLGQKQDIEKALSLGAKDFMIKVNVNLDQIVERIKKEIS
ncbi:MAG: response regulator [Candidatus Paceibacterota bacterium]